MKLTTMKETAEILGITYMALQSAVFHQRIEEPRTKIGNQKLFTPTEIEAAKRYFATVKSGRRGVKNKA